MIIYRPGAITAAQIRAVAGEVELFHPGQSSESPQVLPAPGVGLRHYAPRARLILVEGPAESLAQELAAAAQLYTGERVGILLPRDFDPPALPGAVIFPWGRWSAPEEMARDLYAGLRWLDAQECTLVLCPVPPDEGVGIAIQDRLRKAARKP